jgi:disulfide bond formation protein DsbB
MTPLVQFVTEFFSIGVILSQVLIFLVIIAAVSHVADREGLVHSFARFISKNALMLGFIVSIVTTIGSTFYSLIAGFAACELCWIQRIFLFPQVFLFAVAIYYRRHGTITDQIATTMSFVLSVAGALVAFFQYYSQMFNPSLLGLCLTSGVSCSKLYFVSFGYITIPLMSLTTFLLLIMIVVTHKRVLRHMKEFSKQ